MVYVYNNEGMLVDIIYPEEDRVARKQAGVDADDWRISDN